MPAPYCNPDCNGAGPHPARCALDASSVRELAGPEAGAGRAAPSPPGGSNRRAGVADEIEGPHHGRESKNPDPFADLTPNDRAEVERFREFLRQQQPKPAREG